MILTERALRPRRPKLGLPKIHVHVAEPLDSSEGTLEELTAEAARRVEELRRSHGPPAHVWFD